ncbi:hypothetical protein [Actinoplanes utahensis]|uniref:hypothetical protein n=1 Tax=Actinoplanes utahensis TaxID=1869 RepID=UPI0036217548
MVWAGSNLFANAILRELEEGNLMRGIYSSIALDWFGPVEDVNTTVSQLLDTVSIASSIFDVEIFPEDQTKLKEYEQC